MWPIVSGTDITAVSNIPQNFQHLQLRINARSLGGGTEDYYYFRLNSDSTVNAYNTGAMLGSNSSGFTVQQDFTRNHMLLGYIVGSGGTANAFGQLVITILDYADTTKYKTVISYGGHAQLASQNKAGIHVATWENLSAVTSFAGGPASAASNSNSSFTLYGLDRSYTTGA